MVGSWHCKCNSELGQTCNSVTCVWSGVKNFLKVWFSLRWQNPRTTTTLYPPPHPPAPLTMQAGMYGHTRYWVYSPSWQMVCKKHECYPFVAAVLLQRPNLPHEWNKTSQFTLALWKENERTNILLLNGTFSIGLMDRKWMNKYFIAKWNF